MTILNDLEEDPPREEPDSGDAPRVAVIGMAGRFPGARDVEAFWRNLRDGVESVQRFTPEELLAAGESAERIADPAYVPACPTLADFDVFDAGFFSWSPREAAVTDPQHRIFLETAWSALENAGHDPARFGGAIAVFASCGMPSYMMHHLVTNPDLVDAMGEWLIRHTGNDMNFLATRVSYEFDLRGPSMNVQTACSSSLVALHLAAQSLLSGECDLALAGASTVILPQDRGYVFKEGEILSPDGHCRPFDADSHGTLFGSGAGCLVLRRLDDALADGDRVLAVVRGSALNNDGTQKVGFLAPSVDGQTQVIAEALAIAGLDADAVSMIEAHGTGTAIGDPIEVKALGQAFAGTSRRGFCALGSVKANIGHLGEAAGMASLMKAVMALRDHVIPPTINFTRANPEIDLEGSPFYIPKEARPWNVPGRRIAGVTSLGAGGTNAHVLLEEAPAPEASDAGRPWQLLPVSAKTEPALEAATVNLAARLRADPAVSLADVAYTLSLGRQAFGSARVVIARDAADAATAMENRDPNRVITRARPNRAPAVVFLFPGAGTQYPGMGADLYSGEPEYRRVIDEATALVRPELGFDLRTLLFPSADGLAEADRRLQATSAALPAILATNYAMATLLLARGVEPQAMFGHSMGEYVAACLAGVLSFADALALVVFRGKLIETLPPGGMLSVTLPEAEVRAHLESTPGARQLSIAAVNGPSLCVASGRNEGIAALEAALVAKEIPCTRIHIAMPAHSDMLDPILPPFEAFCRKIKLRPPERRYVSSLTGTWITPAEATDPAYWVQHFRRTVRFADGLATLARDKETGAAAVLLEVGPGRTLGSLSRMQGTTPAPQPISTLPHPTEPESAHAFFLSALGRLWLAGVELQWAELFAGERRHRIPLPTYPFQGTRHWMPRGKAVVPQAHATPAGPLAKLPHVAEWFRRPAWTTRPLGSPTATVDAIPPAWLLFLEDENGVGGTLARRLAARGDSVATVTLGSEFSEQGPGRYTVAPGSRADHGRLFGALGARGPLPRALVHLWNVADVPEARYDSLLWLGQALAGEEQPVALSIVSTGLQAVSGAAVPQCEKALLLGPCLVIARELPHVRTRSIDVPVVPPSSWQAERLVDHLLAEVDALRFADAPDERVVAHRDADRFVQTFAPLPLAAAPAMASLRRGGVYLITGGLGGLGLEVGAWLARTTAARLVLVGRSGLPPRAEWEAWLAARSADHPASRAIRRVLEMERTPGVEVLAARADVRNVSAMRAVVAEARTCFGRIEGVFHAAGAIDDGLLQLKEQGAEGNAVVSTKVEGAQVLDSVLEDAPPDLFVLFSSVSSLLGLEGQVDYTAANAFLDSFARARNARRPGYTVAVNWSAWREVGMAARLAEGGPASGTTEGGGYPWLPLVMTDTAEELRVAGDLQRERDWILREHVVRGAGVAVMPGTGFVELARAAAEKGRTADSDGPIELRDLVFVAPFTMTPGARRRLAVTLSRRDGQLTITSSSNGSEDEGETHVVGRVVEGTAPAAAAPVDLGSIRARCPRTDGVKGGFLDQDFMDFGPRWSNMRQAHYGEGEALIELELPSDFAADLETMPLHPALLDMATGGAQRLIPAFDQDHDFYVPFSYGRVVVHHGLPAGVFSHVRYKPGAEDTAVFDVRMFDPDGVLLVEVTDFVMKRLPARPTGFTGAPATVRGATALRDLALREGIAPAEGLDALARILHARPGAQVVASSLDLDRWRAELEAVRFPTPSAGESDGATSAAAGGARPELASTYVAPSDEKEQLVAEVWQKILGIDRIGVHDNFFELGGHSLLLTQAATRVRKLASVDLPLTAMFSKLTVAALAAEIKRATEAAAAPSKQPQLKALSRDAYRAKRTVVTE